MNKVLIDTNVLIYASPRGLKVHDYEIAAIALSHGIQQITTFTSPRNFVE